MRELEVILCPMTRQRTDYSCEVTIPDGVVIQGVVLTDVVRPIDWVARHAEVARTRPIPVRTVRRSAPADEHSLTGR
jgi:mRNA-degrading endonuclease toxin of MazEF toxin-antitoxin module